MSFRQRSHDVNVHLLVLLLIGNVVYATSVTGRIHMRLTFAVRRVSGVVFTRAPYATARVSRSSELR